MLYLEKASDLSCGCIATTLFVKPLLAFRLMSSTPKVYGDVASSIRNGIAAPGDFIVVSGGYIWVKDNNGHTGGMRGEVWNGRFEVVSNDQVQNVWNTLLTQQAMSRESIDSNSAASLLAWDLAGTKNLFDDRRSESVFGTTDMQLSLLEDEARRRWVEKYVMNDPGCKTE